MNRTWRAPLILRGEVIDTAELTFEGRNGQVSFCGPDVSAHLDKLTLDSPAAMNDLYALSFDDILAYLARLAGHLDLATNIHLQEAFELSRLTSGLSESILRHQYAQAPDLLRPGTVRAMVERLIGVPYIEGWVDQPLVEGSEIGVRVRAFGARCVHIVAGNVPGISVVTMIWNAVTRSDALVKTPSNDPLTAAAMARTMIDMAPDHPLTRHFSTAYWKGGDARVEAALYDPRRIEKIVAWGGFNGIKHVTQYLQPGLDLITLDPKHSATIIGPEAFADEATLKAVAHRLALDVGVLNQEACFNARVVYLVCGLDAAGLNKANRLGQATFQAMQRLPVHLSTPHKAFSAELKEELEGLKFVEDEYRVFGGRAAEGAVIVSQTDEPVDFSRILACRVANIVPVDDVETALASVNAYTQTIGIYPEALKQALRDRLAHQGAQRIVSLGGATMAVMTSPQDGIEPLRRICKWIVEETVAPGVFEEIGVENAAA
jgi:hypothetical protein